VLLLRTGQSHDELDGERQRDGGAAEPEQQQIIAVPREQPGKAVGGCGLEQRKTGGGVAPDRALLFSAVRSELMDASEHERHDAGCEAADDHARYDQRRRGRTDGRKQDSDRLDQEGGAQVWTEAGSVGDVTWLS